LRPDRVQHALELAYGYLNPRERTVAEVRVRLEQRGVETSAIDQVIETLLEQGYLDDARFARIFAQDKRELEYWGADRIRRTLRHRGIDRELIDATLGAEPAQTELDRALALLRRRFPSPPRDRRERDRALGVMLRKGYESELALDALAAFASEAGPPGLP
jgi:regulatory protein